MKYYCVNSEEETMTAKIQILKLPRAKMCAIYAKSGTTLTTIPYSLGG